MAAPALPIGIGAGIFLLAGGVIALGSISRPEWVQLVRELRSAPADVAACTVCKTPALNIISFVVMGQMFILHHATDTGDLTLRLDDREHDLRPVAAVAVLEQLIPFLLYKKGKNKPPRTLVAGPRGGHTKGKCPSKRNKHEGGDDRRLRDQLAKKWREMCPNRYGR